MHQRVAIFGPGLLGGSLALALRERNLAQAISIYARKPESVPEVKASGVADLISNNPAEVVRGADLVVLCVPVGVMKSLIEAALPGLDPQAIVTDVGSVKAPVVADLEPLLQGKARWIGSHPMAGSEQAGFSAARSNLFAAAVTIVTPTVQTHSETIAQVENFWKNLGSRTVRFDPETHDRLVAQISHLPHLVAAALVRSVCDQSLSIIGNGFRDTTRIASGPAELWTEILLSNRKAVAESLDQLISLLQTTREQLAKNDEKGLHDLLAHANHIRSQMTSGRP